MKFVAGENRRNPKINLVRFHFVHRPKSLAEFKVPLEGCNLITVMDKSHFNHVTEHTLNVFMLIKLLTNVTQGTCC